jgi:hypothetical protein
MLDGCQHERTTCDGTWGLERFRRRCEGDDRVETTAQCGTAWHGTVREHGRRAHSAQRGRTLVAQVQTPSCRGETIAPTHVAESSPLSPVHATNPQSASVTHPNPRVLVFVGARVVVLISNQWRWCLADLSHTPSSPDRHFPRSDCPRKSSLKFNPACL